MAKNTAIKNCEFLFKCPRDWEQLSKTDNEGIRFCNVCDKGVYLAEDDDTLKLLAALGKCVAIRRASVSDEIDCTEDQDFLLGMIALDSQTPFNTDPSGNPALSEFDFSDGKSRFLNCAFEDLRGLLPGYCLNDCEPGTDNAIYSISREDQGLWSLYKCSEEIFFSRRRFEVSRVGEGLTVEELYKRLDEVDISIRSPEAIPLGLPFHNGNY